MSLLIATFVRLGSSRMKFWKLLAIPQNVEFFRNIQFMYRSGFIRVFGAERFGDLVRPMFSRPEFAVIWNTLENFWIILKNLFDIDLFSKFVSAEKLYNKTVFQALSSKSGDRCHVPSSIPAGFSDIT